MTLGFGLDLSKYQAPALLPWESWRGVVDFVIARACYGSTRDTHCAEHIMRAREIGAKVGVYIFFRANEPLDAQLSALHAAADLARIADGDIVPAIDIETDTSGAGVENPSWSGPAAALVEAIAETWDNCLVYTTQATWSKLGSPSWLLQRPLWAAHWVEGIPVTPAGIPATIHQFRVGKVDRNGPGGYFANDDPKIDQNRLLRPLPLIGQPLDVEEQERIENQVTAWLATEREHADPSALPEKDEIA